MQTSWAVALAGLAFLAFCQGAALGAEPAVWQPSPGHTQVPIWPGAAPVFFSLGP